MTDDIDQLAAIDDAQRAALIGLDPDSMFGAANAHDPLARAIAGRAEPVADFAGALVADRSNLGGDKREIGDQLRIGGGAVETVGIFVGDEIGGEVATAEARVLHQRREKVDIVRHPVDLERVERRHLRRNRPVTGRGKPGETLVPLSTAFGSHGAFETYARAVAYRLRPATCTVTVTPALHPGLTAPLGWELSKDAREDLRSGLVRAQDLPEDLTPQVLSGAAQKPYPRGEDGPLWRAFQLRRLQEWLERKGTGLEACVPR